MSAAGGQTVRHALGAAVEAVRSRWIRRGGSRSRVAMAHAYGIGCNALVQVLQIPVLGRLWGPDSLAAYLEAVSLLSLFFLLDLGLCSAAATQSLLGGRSGGVGSSTMSAAARVSLGAFAAGMVCVCLFSVLVRSSGGSDSGLSAIAWCALAAMMLSNLCVVPVYQSAFRLQNRTAGGVTWANSVRLAFFVLVTLFSLNLPRDAAIALSATVSTVMHFGVLLRAPGLRAMLRVGDVRERVWHLLWPLCRPLLGNVSMIGNEVLRLHAPVLVMAAWGRPDVVVAYVSARVLSRIPYQLSLVQRSTMATEVSRERDIPSPVRYCLRVFPWLVAIWPLWAGALLVMSVLGWQSAFYLGDDSLPLLGILLANTLVLAVQNSFSAFLQGRNKHFRPAAMTLALTGSIFACAATLAPAEPVAIAGALLVADVAGTAIFLVAVRKSVDRRVGREATHPVAQCSGVPS